MSDTLTNKLVKYNNYEEKKTSSLEAELGRESIDRVAGKPAKNQTCRCAVVVYSWLFEGVERQKAEELLALPSNRPGSFMVRESFRERGEKWLN